jgi:hypothetical protein
MTANDRGDEKASAFFYRHLADAACLLTLMVLTRYVSWPLAIGAAFLFGFGLLGYWIPKKPGRGFLRHFGLVFLFSAALSAVAYVPVWLGWLKG